MYFFQPLDIFLPFSQCISSPGDCISSTEIWCIWRCFFWAASYGAWGQNPLLPHHCPGQLTIGRIPNNRLNCLQTSKRRGNVRKTHKETRETWKAVSAREWIKENMDLPQILWWPDFTNTTENTLKILAEAIRQCQLKKIEKGKGYSIYHSNSQVFQA